MPQPRHPMLVPAHERQRQRGRSYLRTFARALAAALAVVLLLAAPAAWAISSTQAGERALERTMHGLGTSVAQALGSSEPIATPQAPGNGGGQVDQENAIQPPSSGINPDSGVVQCGLTVSTVSAQQVEALQWLRQNVAPRTVFLTAGSLYAGLCAQMRPANLVVNYLPAWGPDPQGWPADVVVSTPQLRALLAQQFPGPQLVEQVPLLASFGQGEQAIQVRQRAPLPERAANAAAVRGLAGVRLSSSAQSVLDEVGIDARLVMVMREVGQLAGSGVAAGDSPSQELLSVADFPLSTANDDPTAPRRVLLLDRLAGQPGDTPGFDEQALQLQQLVVSLPDTQRPSSSGVVVTPSGQRMFQMLFPLPLVR